MAVFLSTINSSGNTHVFVSCISECQIIQQNLHPIFHSFRILLKYYYSKYGLWLGSIEIWKFIRDKAKATEDNLHFDLYVH